MKPQSANPPAGPARRRTSRPKTGWLVVLLVGALVGALAAPSALAQRKGKQKSGSGKTSGAKKKSQKQKPKAKSKKPAAKSKKKAADPLADLKRPPSMNINKPLLTKAEYDDLEKALNQAKWQNVLKAGVNNAASRKVIVDWARWRILGMTRPENRNNLFRLRQSVLYEVGYSARSLKGGPGTLPFRTFVLQEVTKCCEQVLDNNYYVRLQAVMILGNLNLKEFDPGAKPKRPPTAWGPACVPLINKVLEPDDKVQPEPVKIAAARGMIRIALLAPYDINRSRNIVAALIKEFERRNAHPWYQARLAEALGAVDTYAITEAKAVHALAAAVVNLDKSRPFSVRAQSAMALGRAALPRDVNVELLMYEIVNLSVEMSEQYNADLATGDPLPAHWTSSFLRLYFAFNPVDRLEEEFLYKDRMYVKDRYAGLLPKKLTRHAYIKDAYDQIKPVVKHIIEQSDKVKKAPVPTETIAGMKTWLAGHPPKDFKIRTGGSLPALRAMKAAAAKPKTLNGIDGNGKSASGIAGP